MKQISAAEAVLLNKTHRWFFQSSIKGQTDKAFKVRIDSNSGGLGEFWLPKSRILFQVIPDPNPGHQGETLTKYFIPKFFTR